MPSSEESDRETTSTEQEDDDVQEPHSPDHQDKRDPTGDNSPHDPGAGGSASNLASSEGLLVMSTNDDKVADVKKLLNEAKCQAKFYATMFHRLNKENKTYETEKKKEESKAKKKEKQEAEKAERAENRSKIVTINVSTGGGETKPLKVRAGSTIKEVKDLIHQTFFNGLSKKAFKSVQLVYADKTFTDHPRRELNFYKVPDGSSIRVVFTGAGGAKRGRAKEQESLNSPILFSPVVAENDATCIKKALNITKIDIDGWLSSLSLSSLTQICKTMDESTMTGNLSAVINLRLFHITEYRGIEEPYLGTA